MNGPQALLMLTCVLVILGGILVLEIALFRIACILCDVPRPGPFKSIGLVVVLLVAAEIADGVMWAFLSEAYVQAGYPLWEAGTIAFMLALPVHMLICSSVHARFMQIRVREGIAVWFVEKLIKLGILAAFAGLVALILIAHSANG